MQAKNDVTVVSILRHSIKFNAVNIFSKTIAFPTYIIIAVVLIPEEYGVIGFVGLWGMYAGLINPGMDSAAYREMPYLLGKGEEEKAVHLQNVAITSKILYSFIPFIVILCASFFYFDGLIRICLILTAVAYIITTNTNYWSGFNHVRQRFNNVATGNLIAGFVVPLVTLSLIFWLKIYAVLIAPIIGSIIAFIYYIRNAGIGYRLEFDRSELARLIKIGLPLALLTLVYWGYRMADRTMVAAFLPLREMGLYTFAIFIVTFAILLFADFGKVLQPVLWTSLGQARNHIEGFKPLRRIAVYMSIAAAMSIGICQIGFYLLVHLLTTNYIESIPVFNVLAFNIFLGSIVIVPGVILNSSVVNKQTMATGIWSIGLVLNIILDYAVIRSGFGIVGVSWVTVGTQVLVTLILLFTIRRYMFSDSEAKEFRKFMCSILFPLFVSFLLYLTSIFFVGTIQNIYLYGVCSLIFFCTVWLVVLRLFYREFFPKEQVINVCKEGIALCKSEIVKSRDALAAAIAGLYNKK
jgi:O-antigen/teichoic acid export membrane protein